MLLGSRRHTVPAVARQHFQRDTRRPGQTYASKRRPHTLGPARRAAAKLHAHREGALRGISPKPRMGRVYRPRDNPPCHAPRASGIHLVGRVCHKERRIHRPHTASRTHIAPSVATIGTPRLLRQQALLPNQRIPRGQWHRTHRLVTKNNFQS